jgi:dicarboxylate transporter 10
MVKHKPNQRYICFFKFYFNIGASMAVTRGAFVTVGQIAFYEQVKQVLLTTGYFKDNIITHFTSSFVAGAGATLLTMPLDVMKTRMMNAPAGTYSSLFDCFKDIIKVGPSGLFKGFIPAFIRLGKIFLFNN